MPVLQTNDPNHGNFLISFSAKNSKLRSKTERQSHAASFPTAQKEVARQSDCAERLKV